MIRHKLEVAGAVLLILSPIVMQHVYVGVGFILTIIGVLLLALGSIIAINKEMSRLNADRAQRNLYKATRFQENQDD